MEVLLGIFAQTYACRKAVHRHVESSVARRGYVQTSKIRGSGPSTTRGPPRSLGYPQASGRRRLTRPTRGLVPMGLKSGRPAVQQKDLMMPSGERFRRPFGATTMSRSI